MIWVRPCTSHLSKDQAVGSEAANTCPRSDHVEAAPPTTCRVERSDTMSGVPDKSGYHFREMALRRNCLQSEIRKVKMPPLGAAAAVARTEHALLQEMDRPSRAPRLAQWVESVPAPVGMHLPPAGAGDL